MVGDALQIVDVVNVHVLELVAVGINVAWNGDVHKQQWSMSALPQQTLAFVAGEHVVGRSGAAADDISTGDAAVNIVTTSGNITIDAQANDADVIIKVDDNGSAVTAVTFDGTPSSYCNVTWLLESGSNLSAFPFFLSIAINSKILWE